MRDFTQRITATKTLSGEYLYHFLVATNGDWSLKSADQIVYELRAEQFSHRAVQQQFTTAHITANQSSTLPTEFVATIAKGLRHVIHKA